MALDRSSLKVKNLYAFSNRTSDPPTIFRGLPRIALLRCGSRVAKQLRRGLLQSLDGVLSEKESAFLSYSSGLAVIPDVMGGVLTVFAG